MCIRDRFINSVTQKVTGRFFMREKTWLNFGRLGLYITMQTRPILEFWGSCTHSLHPLYQSGPNLACQNRLDPLYVYASMTNFIRIGYCRSFNSNILWRCHLEEHRWTRMHNCKLPPPCSTVWKPFLYSNTLLAISHSQTLPFKKRNGEKSPTIVGVVIEERVPFLHL